MSPPIRGMIEGGRRLRGVDWVLKQYGLSVDSKDVTGYSLRRQGGVRLANSP